MANASILALSTASMVMLPVLAVTLALAMYAVTSLSIVLLAMATPMATDRPPRPKEPAREAAAVSAKMTELSLALTSMAVAMMAESTAAVPSMKAPTSTEMRLSLAEPDPLRLAARAPPDSATEAASTSASMLRAAVASTSSVFLAWTVVSSA